MINPTARRSRFRPLAWILLLAILPGCAPYRGGPLGPPVPGGSAAVPFAELFRYEPGPAPTEIGPSRDWGLYEVQPLHLASSLDSGVKQTTYRLFYYRPKAPIPRPAVVILPITRGDYFSQNFAIYLAERGYVCLRFESTKNFTDDAHKTLAAAERLLRHYVIDVRRAVNWLVRQPEVDGSRIGILGISLGAVIASVVMGVDGRITSGVFLLGGGDLAGILETADEDSLIRFRERVLQHERLDPAAFEERAADLLKPVDPLTHARNLDPRRILMINARYDAVIRRRYVEAFWKAASRPELVFIPTGHYSAALYLPYARAKAFVHFEKTLNER